MMERRVEEPDEQLQESCFISVKEEVKEDKDATVQTESCESFAWNQDSEKKTASDHLFADGKLSPLREKLEENQMNPADLVMVQIKEEDEDIFRATSPQEDHFETGSNVSAEPVESDDSMSRRGPATALKSKIAEPKVKRSQERKKHSCTECSKVFDFSDRLKEHMLVHSSEKPFMCSECGKSFKRNKNLKRHALVHTGSRPFLCEQCGAAFSAEQALEVHTRVHSGEKPYSCTFCEKTFAQYANLQVHLRCHTKEKPFECSECGRAFAQRGSLNNHMRTHTGERPFVCVECGMKFAQVGNLNKHRRIHTGEKPFSCKFCEECFSRTDTLKEHILKDHSSLASAS